MSTPSPEELLSAYLDDELSAVERAEVERLLEATPALRERLEELADVSQAIRSLPRPAAPPELHEQVLAEIQRRPRPAPRAARGPRRWPARAALTAAGLLIGVSVWRFALHSPLPQNDRLAVRSPAPAVELHFEYGLNHRLSGSAEDVSGGSRGATGGNSDYYGEVRTARRDAPLGRTRNEESLDAAVEVRALNREQLQQRVVDLGRPVERGDVLKLIAEPNASSQKLVEFTVVDTMQAVDYVRLLLARQQSVSPRQDASMQTRALGEQNQLVVLEMDRDELTLLLNEIPALDAVVYESEKASETPESGLVPSRVPALAAGKSVPDSPVGDVAEDRAHQEQTERRRRFDRLLEDDASLAFSRRETPSALGAPNPSDSVRELQPLENENASAPKAGVAAVPASRAAEALPESGTWEQARRLKLLLLFRQAPLEAKPEER